MKKTRWLLPVFVLLLACHTQRKQQQSQTPDHYLRNAFRQPLVESPYAGQQGQVRMNDSLNLFRYYELAGVRTYCYLDSSRTALRFDGLLGVNSYGLLFEKKLLSGSMFLCPAKSQPPCIPQPDSVPVNANGIILWQRVSYYGFEGPLTQVLSVRSLDSLLHSPDSLRRLEFRVGNNAVGDNVSVYYIEVKNPKGNRRDSWKKFLQEAELTYFSLAYGEI